MSSRVYPFPLPLTGRAATGGPAPAPTEAGLRDELVRILHTKLIQESSADIDELAAPRRGDAIRLAAEALVDREAPQLTPAIRAEVLGDLLDEVLGWGPLEKLLRDPTVTDILANGASQVYVERQGKLERAGVRFRDDEHLLGIIRRMVSAVGRRVDDSTPMVDARLPDGSRLNAIIPPLALTGPMLSIRRFGARLGVADLVALKALPAEVAEFLRAAVKARMNVVVSGGTGSGKTTLLNALSAYIPRGERLITIEDAAELRLQQEHVASLESRPPNMEGKGEVTIRDLLRNALRMRPSRIIIGECRGAEALDMLQAMNTGHTGSMTTLHANSPRDALTRLETMVMMSGLELPLRAVRQQIAASLNLVVQVSRVAGGGRKVVSVTEVTGAEGESITTQELFRYHPTGVDASGRARGRFETTGARPCLAERFAEAGVPLTDELFRARELTVG